jgi:hypothetical protein
MSALGHSRHFWHVAIDPLNGRYTPVTDQKPGHSNRPSDYRHARFSSHYGVKSGHSLHCHEMT